MKALIHNLLAHYLSTGVGLLIIGLGVYVILAHRDAVAGITLITTGAGIAGLGKDPNKVTDLTLPSADENKPDAPLAPPSHHERG